MTGTSGFKPKSLSAVARIMNHKLFRALLCIPLRRGQRQMARINSHRKIGAAALFVGGIDSRIQTLRQNACSLLPTDARLPKNPALQSCADRCATPRRESAPAPPSSAHLPTPWVIPDTAPISDSRGLRIPWLTRHAVLQQHTRDPLGGEPVTDLRAFQIDGQNLIAPARKHDDCCASILSLRRIDRHRGPRDGADSPGPATDEVVLRSRRRDFRPRDGLRIRHCPRPYRYLRMSRRWLPDSLLRAHTARRKQNTKAKSKSFITIPTEK